MKKTLLLAAMAAFALTSCSKDETTGINTGSAQDIGFRASLGKATRGVETKIANLTTFAVTALKGTETYYTNVVYTKQTDNSFTSTPAYYWPSDDSELQFFAYSPQTSTLGGTLKIANDAKTLTNFAPATDVAKQVDFIVAAASGKKSSNTTGVELTFNHALSQIEILAKNSSTAYQYKVKGVRIGKPVSKGTYTFPAVGATSEAVYGSWAPAADKTNYEITYSSEITLVEQATSIMGSTAGTAMLIPQQLSAWNQSTDKTNTSNGAYLAIKVQITTKDGALVYPSNTIEGQYDWVAIPIDTKWESGRKYTYTIDFSNGAGFVDPEKPAPTDPEPFKPGEPVFPEDDQIKFSVTVNDWIPSSQSVTM